MPSRKIIQLVEAPRGNRVVLQGNLAFAVGCARGGIHVADGYPGTPSTEVIDRGLKHVQDRMHVGWSVNEANAVALAFGSTMTGADAVVTMKVPGLFQAADVVSTAAFHTCARGGLVLYIATDFVPSSTQHVIDPRYFLKSAFIPVIEPRDHQEMVDIGPRAAYISRTFRTPVAVLANGLLCHSEGLVRLNELRQVPRVEMGSDFTPFMNLPGIARQNYNRIMSERMPALTAFSEDEANTRIEWHDRSLGVVTHGISELYLREVWNELPVKPSILSLEMTYPVPARKLTAFAEGLTGPIMVLGDGLRFVQEELASLGIPARGKDPFDPTTEWTPETVARALGVSRAVVDSGARPSGLEPVRRPPNICAGCPYRAFGLVVAELRKKKKIVASFGDIGCNTLLYFLKAIDTCVCMGAADSQRQGVVLVDPSLANRTISVLGDSTECHSGLDSTRNAVFRNIPGVKVVLDNETTAMTGGQPAPSSPRNLRGDPNRFDLETALRGEGAQVVRVDAYDGAAIKKALTTALGQAESGAFTVLILHGHCMMDVPARDKVPRYQIDREQCSKCDLCLICPGLERDEEGYPRFTHLCTSCGGAKATCVTRCRLHAIVPSDPSRSAPPPPPPAYELPSELPATLETRPATIRVSVRGVGGQGNLFLGKVLAEVAMMAGYDRLVKGETHGMAQLGGPVVSTFGCGDVYSPVIGPESTDVLVVLELSEVLRPGFVETLKPGGVILLNRLRIVPPGCSAEEYPSPDRIREYLGRRRVIEFDALEAAREIGDFHGKTSNVIALGLLSTISPLSDFPLSLWQRALLEVSPAEMMKRANLAAFEKGRSLNPLVDATRDGGQ